MTCLDDRALLRVHTGDGDVAERSHAMACPGCTARLTALARDLGRLDTVLRGTPPPTRVPVRGVSWAALAAAAVLLLAIALWRNAPVTPGRDGGLDLALLDEVAVAMADTDDDALLGDEPVADVRSTCTWGDPLLEVGCDEPDVTQVAWR